MEPTFYIYCVYETREDGNHVGYEVVEFAKTGARRSRATVGMFSRFERADKVATLLKLAADSDLNDDILSGCMIVKKNGGAGALP